MQPVTRNYKLLLPPFCPPSASTSPIKDVGAGRRIAKQRLPYRHLPSPFFLLTTSHLILSKGVTHPPEAGRKVLRVFTGNHRVIIEVSSVPPPWLSVLAYSAEVALGYVGWAAHRCVMLFLFAPSVCLLLSPRCFPSFLQPYNNHAPFNPTNRTERTHTAICCLTTFYFQLTASSVCILAFAIRYLLHYLLPTTSYLRHLKNQKRNCHCERFSLARRRRASNLVFFQFVRLFAF